MKDQQCLALLQFYIIQLLKSDAQSMFWLANWRFRGPLTADRAVVQGVHQVWQEEYAHALSI